jgi:tetratricopeptide (TPR) repeat protein
MAGRFWLTLWAIGVFFAVSPAWGEPVSLLLEKAIYTEETKGDLDEAIGIYQKIIADNKGRRFRVAKAYYRLGACYLKKGDNIKAEETFKELLIRFPDQ